MTTDCIANTSVARLADGRYEVRWGEDFATGPVSVHAGLQPDAIDHGQPLATTASRSAVVAAAGWRPYFLLVAERGPRLVVAERGVPLEGGVNFRDLGGYRTDDGRRVCWGRLFRSGHMSKLTESDQASFTALGIRTVCDFRMTEERANENVHLKAEPHIETLGIPPGLKDRFFLHRLFQETDDPEVVAEAIHDIMRCLVSDCASHYARLFEALLAAAPGSVLLNCSAGKERTGVGAALLLTALGVPRSTILYDFALSRRYFPAAAEMPRALQKYNVEARPGRDIEALMAPLLYTRESYLECVFDTIDQHHGDDLAFLRDALGVGPAECARLRARFTC